MKDRNDIKADTHFEDRVSDFLRGKLSEEQEKVLVEELKANSELAARAALMARLARQMDKLGKEQDAALTDALKGMDKKDVERILAESLPRRSHFRWVWLAVPVAAALLVFSLVGYHPRRISSLGKEYVFYFPQQEFYRGEQDTLRLCLNGYYGAIADRENLAETIRMLSDMWDNARKENYNVYTDHMPEIGWLLANAYLRGNQKAEALQVLEQLADEYPDNTALGKKVRELQAKLHR